MARLAPNNNVDRAGRAQHAMECPCCKLAAVDLGRRRILWREQHGFAEHVLPAWPWASRLGARVAHLARFPQSVILCGSGGIPDSH
eukprot:929704-Pyramimonas_sp.AAC.1